MVRFRFVAVAVAVAGVSGALAQGAWTAVPRRLGPPLTYVLENSLSSPAGTPTGGLTRMERTVRRDVQR